MFFFSSCDIHFSDTLVCVSDQEVLADPEAETAEEQLIKQFMKKDLEKVLDSLNPR